MEKLEIGGMPSNTLNKVGEEIQRVVVAEKSIPSANHPTDTKTMEGIWK